MHAVAKAPVGALESQDISKSFEHDKDDSLEKKNPSPAPMSVDHSTKYRAEDASQGEDRGNGCHVLANLLQGDHFWGNDRHHRVDTRPPPQFLVVRGK